MTTEPIVITQVIWNATCSCGWKSDAPNDADTMGNKVRNHLMVFHRDNLATIRITSFTHRRKSTELPL